MKINKKEYIFITDGYRGGANTFMRDHMNYLIKKKQKVILIDKDPKKTFENLSSKIISYKVNSKYNNKNLIDSVKKIIKSSENKITFLVITNFVYLIKFYFFFKELNKNKTKIILTIHSGIFNMTLKSYLGGLLFSLLYKRANYLFFGSNSAKSWWVKTYPWMNIKKSLIHFNGISLKKKILIKRIPKKIQISFAGRLEKENNPEFFLEIAKKYLEDNKNAVFNVFGDGPLLKSLKKKYKTKNIIFHGWVDKKNIYKVTNLIIVTSPINNFPYVALEAKSYGIPVVSCSRGDIKKIIKNGKDGLLKYTSSKKEMILLIKKIVNNYKRFTKNALERSKLYEIDNSCKKFWNSINA